ncbi:MAG: histidinol dehydrogenase [Gammaproteobacteria bacterium]|nr:histidinol dehydrogenase [Gammaproteobacteria bacterium]
MLTILNQTHPFFHQNLKKLLQRGEDNSHSVDDIVREIIAQIRREGDSALLSLTSRLDGVSADTVEQLEIPRQELEDSLSSMDCTSRDALEAATRRIREYHEREVLQSWKFSQADGTTLGQKITPLDRMGLYVPGGKAAYPSSVLMTAVPAKVAGVQEVIMTVPSPGGEVSQMVLAAAALAGVDRVFRVGGAQAIAALAYGTQTIPAVDKIVGPGNIYVATAKKMVFGKVGIDMIAGPSEVVVICDDSVDPDWVAMDLFAQAEHDELAQSIAITDSEEMANQISQSIEKLLPTMERREIITESLSSRGAIVITDSLRSAAELSNRIAPEHLELMVREPKKLEPLITHAGAIFLGKYSAESLGDYCAGPSHVLPTSGTARFSSPLGVYDYQKRSSVIEISAGGARNIGGIASILARSEGLTAHARSAEYRRDNLTESPEQLSDP